MKTKGEGTRKTRGGGKKTAAWTPAATAAAYCPPARYVPLVPFLHPESLPPQIEAAPPSSAPVSITVHPAHSSSSSSSSGSGSAAAAAAVVITAAEEGRALLAQQRAILTNAQQGLASLSQRQGELSSSLEGERAAHAAKAEAAMTTGKKAAAAARHFESLCAVMSATVAGPSS